MKTTASKNPKNGLKDELNRRGEALVKALYKMKKPGPNAERAPGWVHLFNDWLWNLFWE